MSDDDLDLDLGEEPVKRARPPRAARPAPAPVGSNAAPGEVVAGPASAKAVGVKKPSLVARASAYVKHPQWNGRTFLGLLIFLIVVVLFAENISPVRFYFMGLALELPKSIAFILNVAIGALLMWLWQRRSVRPSESGK